jgi:hypothetical protein
MRLPFLALVLAASACGAGDVVRARSSDAWAEMTPDLVPFQASESSFVDVKDGSPRTLKVVPAADGASARLVLQVADGPAREILVTRRDRALYFSGGPELGTELIRLGAHPGDSWDSEGRHVSFDGWERVLLPHVSVDAVRVTARRGPQGLQQVETWWFAPGVGLLRLKSDHGSLFTDELVRTGP